MSHARAGSSDRLARAAGGLLLAAGLTCLGIWMQGRLEAESTRIQVRTLLETREGTAHSFAADVANARIGAAASAAAVTIPKTPADRPRPGSPVGRLSIPGRGVSAPILVGDDAAILRRAAGLIPGTSLPGQAGGNCAVAGHRDSFFRGLEHVRPGDRVEVETPTGSFAYRVQWTKVVDPQDTWVLEPVRGESTLTLVTCYPFRWIGHAPHRFVVRAVRKTTRPAGPPEPTNPRSPS